MTITDPTTFNTTLLYALLLGLPALALLTKLGVTGALVRWALRKVTLS